MRLFIFGAGGHGRELAWLARDVFGPAAEITHVISDQTYRDVGRADTPVVLLSDVRIQVGDQFVAAVGDPVMRIRAAKMCESLGLIAASVVHPRVERSSSVSVDRGAVVCAGSVLTTNVLIGAHTHINVGCSISHDVQIGPFSTLSPGVRICGYVETGREVYIGAGATVINGSPGSPIRIGDRAVIGAGACVIGDVESDSTYVGVPARRIR